MVDLAVANVRLSRLAAVFFIALGVAWPGVFILPKPVRAANERLKMAELARRFDFDIPSQKLQSALDAFSTTSGIELLYDSNLVDGAVSRAVKGNLTAHEAIAQILAESGLSMRSVALSTITIVREVGVTRREHELSPDFNRHAAYFAVLQSSFVTAFCHYSVPASPSGRVVVRFTVLPSGRLERIQVMDAADGAPHDRRMIDALSRVRIDSPPPPDLPQPLMMLIRPPSPHESQSCLWRR